MRWPRIEDLRIDHDLTQQQVADAVWISLREYQKIEKGELLPGSKIFLRLIYFFELNFEDYREDITEEYPIAF